MVPDACEKTKEGSLHEPAVARELPVRSADRDRSPVAACGPRQHPWKITHALVFARPLRAGTARGPNLIGSWSQRMRKASQYLDLPRRRCVGVMLKTIPGVLGVFVRRHPQF